MDTAKGPDLGVPPRERLLHGHGVSRPRSDRHSPAGHAIRIVVVGDAEGPAKHGSGLVVPMKHVVEYLQDYLSEHWSVLRYAQFKDPAYGVLALIEKWHVEPLAVRRTMEEPEA